MASQDSGPVLLTPGTVVGKTEPVIGGGTQTWPRDPEDVPIAMWDSGTFVMELINLHMSPKKLQLTESQQKTVNDNPEALLAVAQQPPCIKVGTYRGTQLAITKMYELVESK